MTDSAPAAAVASRPSIAYVDESQDERDNFFGDAFDSGYFDKIYTLHPDDDLAALVDKLLDLRIDALVSDFNLSDAGPKTYTGVEVVEAFLGVREGFPCFIRTSFGDEAMTSSPDVNRVYSKNAADEQAIGRNLFKRISLQIEHHKLALENWEREYEELISIPAGDRTISQLERLLELDGVLEQHMSADQALAPTIKRQLLEKDGLFAKQDQLVDETEKLIAAMKHTLGD